jgi:hypothetical protein
MPSRLCTHETLICAAQEAGYIQTSVRDFFHRAPTDQTASAKFFVHRHDIDTDLRTTRKLFELEKKHGIKASYYFRLSTLDFGLMREIEDYGSEASYHYEEVAHFAKKNKIKDPALVRDRLPEIRNAFRRNFERVERQLGKKLRTVASHGDFANRLLKVNNTEILADEQLRKECGIDCEAYDRSLLDLVDIYITDRPPPQYYRPHPPLKMVGLHRNIYLVTHPRQCETNWKENTKDNLFRFYEAVNWWASTYIQPASKERS